MGEASEETIREIFELDKVCEKGEDRTADDDKMVDAGGRAVDEKIVEADEIVDGVAGSCRWNKVDEEIEEVDEMVDEKVDAGGRVVNEKVVVADEMVDEEAAEMGEIVDDSFDCGRKHDLVAHILDLLRPLLKHDNNYIECNIKRKKITKSTVRWSSSSFIRLFCG